MKKPKIGVSTKALKKRRGWQFHLKDLDSKVIEINNGITHQALKEPWINKIKPELKKYDLSLHTETSRLFTAKEKDFRRAEQELIRAEIVLCKILGIKELIFHLKQEKLTKKEENKLREIIRFAKKNKVNMIYESNKDFLPDTCLNVLKRFQNLRYNLDIGHLNIGSKRKTFNYKLDDFINKIKKRIVYMHIHNNDGKKDLHTSLKKGNLDWKHIFDLLDFKNIKKVIIEQHEMRDVRSTKKDLENYFKKRK